MCIRDRLESDRTLFAASKTGEIDLSLLHHLHLMTAKPFLYVFNTDEDVLTDDARKQELRDVVAPADAVFLDAQTETELLELDDEDASELLAAVGQDEPGLQTLAKAGFDTLGLQTYLTAGPKEARAWTIHKGDTAPQAAGVIHSDFEKGFIRPRSLPSTTWTSSAPWQRHVPTARCARRARITSWSTATSLNSNLMCNAER